MSQYDSHRNVRNADLGKSLSVIDDATFSAVVIMVIVTTLVTPPVLKLPLARREKEHAS